MYYFTHHKWPQAWIDEAVNLTRDIWTSRYKPTPVSAPPVSSPTPAPAAAGSRPKKSHVDFDIVLNYGDQVAQGPDVLEEYLRAPPLPQETDPIGYWLKQRKAGEAMANPSTTALAQMALDYLSVPGLFFRDFIHMQLILMS